MTRLLGAWLLLAVALMAAPTPLLAATANAVAVGVRVVEVKSLVVDQSAPLQVDDLILAYRVGAADGQPSATIALHSALQWRLFEAGELMRQAVVLDVVRAGVKIAVPLGDGLVQMRVASIAVASALEAADDRLLDAIAAHDRAAADAAYLIATEELGAQPDAEMAALIGLHGARGAMAFDDWKSGRARLAQGLSGLPASLLGISLMEVDTKCTSYLGEWRVSLQTMQDAMPMLEQTAPHTLVHARIASALAQIESFSTPKEALVRAERAVADARAACGRCDALGLVLVWYGDVLSALSRYDDAGAAYAESLAIARAITPNTLAVATRLLRQARPLRLTGRPDLAVPKLQEALSKMRMLKAPETGIAPVLNALGTAAHEQGDLNVARSWYLQSLEISERLAPDSMDAANAHHNLAQADMSAGDLVSAERHLLAGIRIMEKADNGLYLGIFLTTRAQLEIERGDDELAETMLKRLRTLQTKINPDAQSLGITEIELAKLYLRNQRTDESELAWKRAIAIFEKLPGDSLVLAEPLAEFGYAELALGHLDRAAEYFSRAYGIFERSAPDSLRATIALQGSGEAALASKHYVRAERLLRAALRIRRRDAADTIMVVQTLHALGQVASGQRQNNEARALYCEATEVLDRASLHSGGGDLGETRFRSRFADVYHDCLAATVEQGDAAAALRVLERGRARGFRRALEQRRINFRSPVQQRASAALATNILAYDQALDSANDPSLDAAIRAQARVRAGQLQQDRAGLQSEFAKALPELAGAYLATPNVVENAQRALGTDTAFVAFSVGTDSTIVLAVRPGMVPIARRIALGRDALRARVQNLRTLIVGSADGDEKRFLQASADLDRDLLGPVQSQLDGARRLLISPDAALHALPFAALWQADAQKYRIESSALVIVDSLSAPVPKPHNTDKASGNILLAVGDPTLNDQQQPEIGRRLRSVGAAMRSLPALPSARREVQSLARRYPGRTHLLVGTAATEAHVRAESGSAQQIHFAVHALFDPERPFDSALVLRPGASGAKDDGLFQVWEIFEDLRLDADLVVLSGCNTAAGKDFAGEGLLGFSRAFAFAGARSTLASLWPVEDESTAQLMGRFYAERDAGNDDSLALQQAMLEMLHRGGSGQDDHGLRGVGGLVTHAASAGRLHSPFYWAAFQLYGD